MLPVSASASDDFGGFFSWKVLGADARIAGEEDNALGFGFSVGARWKKAYLEYDYSRVTSFKPEFQFDPFSPSRHAFNLAVEQDLAIYSHNAFVGYRVGRIIYADFKAGHSYQRIKEAGDEKRVLDEFNTPAAGIELGLGGDSLTLGLQYLWLGDNYKQTALTLRVFW
ncbi:hypothetical protein FHR99_002138 [Litorivivens lipolytica]|uniref:Outer membrane protein beta-barrel domain-containing protein n=1 Tax=Litorivivens lipolytica TaxID=1524264 RepID=A0A7W4W5L0_9GAMM|nr:hypothetical protein [Litorivivens lipolytica]MBB3047872.1 hypothetical protein [Litorivivens lipolytica]